MTDAWFVAILTTAQVHLNSLTTRVISAISATNFLSLYLKCHLLIESYTKINAILGVIILPKSRVTFEEISRCFCVRGLLPGFSGWLCSP